MRQSNIGILLIEVKLNIVRQNKVNFMPIEISSKTCVKILLKCVNILFLTCQCNIEIKSALIVRVVSVGIDGTIQRKMRW